MKKEKPERQLPPREEPKGLLRMFSLLDRDGGKFFKAGVLAFLGLLPYMAALTLAVASGSLIFLLACILFGMAAAPGVCAAADTVMRSQRGEVGWWWWDSYKTAWKNNARSSLLPGAIAGFVVAAQIWLLYLVARMEDPVLDFWLLFGAAVLELAVFGYYLPMLVCIELPFPALVRNCFVLFFCHPVRSLLSALVQLVYYGLILIWFPLTSVIFFATSVWLPLLMSTCILRPVLEKHFHLEEVYEARRKQQWENGENEVPL